ncbi:MAG: LysR family transcriptional regulator [Candidatus Fimivivens sp.]|nr:LysR family transcriptional regulator [Candidatus Fimivivens sp.]
MTERELFYMKTIAKEKSISKAAAKLYVSQPSLSQYVARVESALGEKIFNRTGNGLSLTYAGEKYMQTATSILNIYSDFKNEISGMSQLKSGRITIGITYFLSMLILPDILSAFRRAYPAVEIFVVEKSTNELEKLLATGEIDFAIMHIHKKLPVNTEIQEYCRLLEDPFVAVMSAQEPLAQVLLNSDGVSVVALNALKDSEFIMVHKDQRIRQISDFILASADFSPKIALTTRNCETARQLSIKGVGVSLLPLSYINHFSFNHDAAIFGLDNADAYWIRSVMIQKNGYLSAASQEFILMLRDAFVTKTKNAHR